MDTLPTASRFKPTVATYQARIFDLRKAFAEQFPERNDIYIVDETLPPEEEIARAAKALGVPDLAQQLKKKSEEKDDKKSIYPRIVGYAVPVETPDKRMRWVTFGHGYHQRYQLDKLPKTAPLEEGQLAGLTRVKVHELVHGLSYGDGENGTPAYHQRYAEYFGESLAEAVSIDVMARHKLFSPGAFDAHMANHDTTAMDPTDPYAPSAILQQIKQRYHVHVTPYDPKNFKGFNHLRDSYERGLRIAESLRDGPEDLKVRDYIDAIVRTVQGHFAGQMKEKSDIDDWRERAKKAAIQWIKERPDVFPGFERQQQAVNYLQATQTIEDNYTAQHVPIAEHTYPEYTSLPVLPLRDTYPRVVAGAWLRQAKTNDALEVQVAGRLLGMWSSIAQPPISPETVETLQKYRKDTEWAQRIINGESLQTVIPDMEKTAVALRMRLEWHDVVEPHGSMPSSFSGSRVYHLPPQR